MLARLTLILSEIIMIFYELVTDNSDQTKDIEDRVALPELVVHKLQQFIEVIFQ